MTAKNKTSIEQKLAEIDNKVFSKNHQNTAFSSGLHKKPVHLILCYELTHRSEREDCDMNVNIT